MGQIERSYHEQFPRGIGRRLDPLLRRVIGLGSNDRRIGTREPHSVFTRPSTPQMQRTPPNSSGNPPLRDGSPAAATISATPAKRSWPRSDSALERFRI